MTHFLANSRMFVQRKSAPICTSCSIAGNRAFFRKRKRKLSNSFASNEECHSTVACKLMSRTEMNHRVGRTKPHCCLSTFEQCKSGRKAAADKLAKTLIKSALIMLMVISIIVAAVVAAAATTRASAIKSGESGVNQMLEAIETNPSFISRQLHLYYPHYWPGASGGRQDIGSAGSYAASRQANNGTATAVVPTQRLKRSAATAKSSTTRLVGVSGRWLELQCPLASELSVANPQDSLTIVWSRNGIPLSQLSPRHRISAQNGSLVIVDAQAKLDEATYECTLMDKQRQVVHKTSGHKFELSLVVAPRLAPFEFPADAQVGMKLVLTCSTLEGQQPISFVWLKDNQIIQPSQQQQLKSKDVANQALNQLHQQQLTDKQALGLPPAVQSTEYLVLSSSSAGDTSEAGDQTLQQQQQQQLPLPLLSDANIRIRQSDDYSILSIDKLELKHSGRYTCSAQNEAARSSHSAQLVINAPPTLTVEPRDADLVSGQSAVIDCAASGHPRPAISWSRARELREDQWDYVPVYDSSRYSNLPNGSLAMANVSQREQGYYLCSAKNGFGPGMTKLIKITVHEPARFATKYKSLETRIEEKATLVCEASGEPPIALEWLDKQSNVIQRDDKRFIIDNEQPDGEPQSAKAQMQQQQQQNGTVVSRLILARSGRPDSGHYTCQASNKHGSDKMVTNLLVLDVPDKPTDLKVTNVTSSTVSLRWQIGFTGNSPISSYLVQYQSDDPLDDLLGSSPPNNVAGQAQSSGATASPSSLSDNKSASGAAKTSPASDSAQQQQLQDSSATTLRAALDALTVASNLEMNADEAIDRTLVELTVEQSASHLVVRDLRPHCVYRLRLAAINKIGLGEFSEWMRAKTEEAPPSGLALKIQAAATGPNSVKITWSPPDRRSWNGQLIGFQLGYRPIDSSFELNKTIEWQPPTYQSMLLDADSTKQRVLSSLGKPPETSGKISANSTKSRVEESPQFILRQHLRQMLAQQQQELVAHLTNLQRSITYLVWIQAINQRGFGPKSHAISVKTLDDVPPSAPAIRIQSMGPNSITVAWSLLSNFVSSANQYTLYYRRVPQQPFNASSLSQFLPALGAPPQTINEPAQSNQLEPGPFIERTLSSQQLLVGANMFGHSDQQQSHPHDSPLTIQQPQQPALFMHQQSQHYQQFVYTLNQLDCGSVYEFYMTTRNSVGKSEPSALLTTRTLGEPPLAPANRQSLFTRIGTNDVSLNLGAWSTGGCPISHIALRYKQVPTGSSGIVAHSGANSSNNNHFSNAITTSVPSNLLNAINNQQLPPKQLQHPATTAGDQVVYLLKSLAPVTCYELDIIAQNAAGQTTAQYEFVTASLNGSRAGYSRKEGIYRIDQRGNPIEQPPAMDGGPRSIEQQQASFGNGQGASATSGLLPLLVMLLCFVCLIISSAFCYYHLTNSWKQHRQRRSSGSDSGSSGAAGACGARSLHCGSSTLGHLHQSSPVSVMNKSSSLWRLNNRHRNQPDHQTDLQGENSPLHTYCLRGGEPYEYSDPPGTKSFTQSVSMKDFNLIAQGGQSQVAPARVGNSSTLNLKNYQRALACANADANKTATMRPRHFSEHSTYQPNQALNPTPGYGGCGDGMVDYSCATNNQQHCTYSTVLQASNHEHQETSWTTTNVGTEDTYGGNKLTNATATNYAIPSSTNTYGHAPVYGQLNNQHRLVNGDYGEYSAAQNVYGQASIDACIQQLLNNQYQEQQQYAMVVNQKPINNQANKCLYGISQQDKQAQQMDNHQQALVPASGMQVISTRLNQNGSGSVVDSSSGSSGIDVGHSSLDCASSTGTSNNSNLSANNEYNQMAQAEIYPPPPPPTN